MLKTEESHFNSETYAVICRITGEEVPVQIFIEKASKEYWERAYAKTLAEYINVSGSNPNKVLAYLIKNKNVDNYILNTVRGIADELKISKTHVSDVFKVLKDKGFLKKMRNGCYFLSPEILRHGSKTRGAMLLRLWDES